MPNLWDFVIAALFAAAWPLHAYFIEWPHHVKRIASGDPRARVDLYRRTIAEEWAITAVIFAVTLLFARPIAALGLRAPHGWRLALGVAVPVLYGLLLAAQVPAITRNAD